MRREPLFIRFANGVSSGSDIINSLLESSNKETVEIAQKKLEDIPDLRIFREDFKKALLDLIDNGISQYLINYVNSYTKPSLIEYVNEGGNSRVSEDRKVAIKAEDAPWVEAVVCYNLCLYIRMFGIKEIKKCPVCFKFFSNKGKYAKYCSDGCKERKSS